MKILTEYTGASLRPHSGKHFYYALSQITQWLYWLDSHGKDFFFENEQVHDWEFAKSLDSL